MGQFSAKISPNPGSLLSGNQQSVPGVGTVTASAFVAAVEDPENFRNSRAVGAWVGLTPRRYQSGEVDHDGHISRRGDSHLRGLLYEAAAVLLNRSRDVCTLRTWALELKERIGFKRAAVALARKLAVIMHAMLRTDGRVLRSTWRVARGCLNRILQTTFEDFTDIHPIAFLQNAQSRPCRDVAEIIPRSGKQLPRLADCVTNIGRSHLRNSSCGDQLCIDRVDDPVSGIRTSIDTEDDRLAQYP